ncbi:MAG: hypothetical protein AB7W37_05325 [Syntrophobacteraceae bacterium]|jgi:hypothetical protein
MPYGAQPGKLDCVYASGATEIAVLPEVMKMLDLAPGQTVDEDTAQKIVAENERLTKARE